MRARPLTELSDEELFSELKRCVALERENTVEVLRHLAELDRRRAVEITATPSLFVYCVRELGYSEGGAYRRIHAARCARLFPRVYILLRRGRITLTAVSLLAPHLCRENHRRLLELASGKTRFEVERLVSTLEPKRERRETIRPLGPRLSEPAVDSGERPLPMLTAPPDSAQPDVRGRSPETTAPTESPVAGERRVEFKFSANEGFLAKIRRAQEVLWHKHPRGRLEDILGEAIEALLDKRDPARKIARRAKRNRAASVTSKT